MSTAISIAIGIGLSPDSPVIVPLDPDAEAFILAAGITDPTEISAINTLVEDLKATGSLWALLQAIYPIVGGTATTHKYNLRNPLDTDAAFRLTFSGGWTHTTDGMTPNGINGYANTHFNPGTDLAGYTSCSIGVYSRTSNATDGVDLGANTSVADIYLRPANASITFIHGRQPVNNVSATIATDGMIHQSRGTNIIFEAYRNGVNVGTNTSIMFAPLTVTSDFYLGARNTGLSQDLFSDRQLAFAYLGPRLNVDQNLQLYDIVQTYQTNLSREV